MSQNKPYILLVDDEPSNLLLLEELLSSEGYQTISVTSGIEAINAVHKSKPELILLDVMMPGIDGFEVCKQLRESFKLQTIPIVFLTALDDDEYRLKGLQLMGDDYLTKPINSSILLAKVSNILQLNRMRQKAQQIEIRQETQNQLTAAWKISEHLSEKFRLFVPEQFLSRIAPQGLDSIQLGNVREEELTVLFCDIRGFTTIAESQEAIETFQWLNAFFTQMSQAISANHGFIDKFLGDALMAVFDRPESHAQDALTAAINMQQSLKIFNRKRKQYNLADPVKIGIGIHTGMGLIGTIGSSSRMDSTVIGDVVNTAARIEELTKSYKASIIATEKTINKLTHPQVFEVKFLDRINPRGKQQILEIYKIGAA
jgi:adenylate cyclase